jgi:hypothetical protein
MAHWEAESERRNQVAGRGYTLLDERIMACSLSILTFILVAKGKIMHMISSRLYRGKSPWAEIFTVNTRKSLYHPHV